MVKAATNKQAPALKKRRWPKKTPETSAPPITQASEASANDPASVPAPAPESVTVGSSDDKDKEIERLRALLAVTQTSPSPATNSVATITAIIRPNGEAGDKKRGFVLKEAMQLTGSREERAMYTAIV
ncbi:hypothetical protein H0H81_002772, partial [Sphagnurus paluster]